MAAKRKVLVTGGAGFIGANLCAKLLSLGCEVICLDNFCSAKRQNAARLLDNPDFRLVRQDVASPLDFAVDEIYNLACPASPARYQANSLQTLKTNVLGTINVLELALKVKAKVLQASTSEVYGDPAVHPQAESYRGNVNTVGPRSCYDEGKRCAETLLWEYHRRYGLEVKIVRIFNTYGPGMDINDGRVVSNFVIQALKGEALTIYGDGSQTRSFCYIDDLIDGIIMMMNTGKDFTGPVNLGNPAEYNVRDFAELVIALSNSDSGLRLCELPVDDPRRRCPDIRLAKEKLGWEPKVALPEGLAKTIAYFREALGGERAH